MNNNFYKLPFISNKQIAYVVSIVTAFIILYYQTIEEMVKNWLRDPNYSHGFIIPILCLLMINRNKHSLKNSFSSPSYLGLIILLFSMCIFIFGRISAEMFTMRSSIIISIIGIVIFLKGIRYFLIISIPIAYLFFMVPIPKIIWNQVAFPMQLISANIASSIVAFFDIPILREGNILYLHNITLEVVDACSGLRSLIALFAISSFLSYMSSLKPYFKIILFLAAGPIAIATNILRLVSTAILSSYVSAQTAHGYYHDLSGILIFLVAIILLYCVKYILTTLEN